MPMNRDTRAMSFSTAFTIWAASTSGILYGFALLASLTFAK